VVNREELNRCHDGRACVEVTSRLKAADDAARRGDNDHARRMRENAARHAEACDYGNRRSTPR
jgi:hypothetical protein